MAAEPVWRLAWRARRRSRWANRPGGRPDQLDFLRL